MPKSNKEIRELLECLKVNVELYISSVENGTDVLVNHFKISVLPILKEKGLFKSYKDKLTKYVRVLDAKTVSTFHNFRASIRNSWDNLKQINKIIRYDRNNQFRNKYFLIESFKMAYVDFTNLLMIASQMFFALEFYCKILCALGCVKFALKIARSEVIQHNACWKQIKRFSEKDCTYCETCIVSETCKSEMNFEALSRIYAYSMKIRQIADYTP